MDPLIRSIGANGIVCKERGILIDRYKELSSFKAEMSEELMRRDADHEMRHTIQGQRPGHDLRIGTQLFLPELVSHNHFGRGSGAESRSLRQLHVDRREIIS